MVLDGAVGFFSGSPMVSGSNLEVVPDTDVVGSSCNKGVVWCPHSDSFTGYLSDDSFVTLVSAWVPDADPLTNDERWFTCWKLVSFVSGGSCDLGSVVSWLCHR